MRRVLFVVGDMPVHPYPFFFSLAVMVGAVLLLMPKISGLSLTPAQAFLLVFFAVFGGVFGARLFYVVQYGKPLCVALNPVAGGLVFQGGLVGGIFGALLFCLVTRSRVLPVFDALAPALCLGEVLVRIGCFLNGCCWGRPCSLPWAVRFPGDSPPWKHEVRLSMITDMDAFTLPVHPVQLYMSLLMLAAFFLLILLFRRRGAGVVFSGYLMLHGAARFFAECFRGDSERMALGLTLYQCIALGELVVGCVVLGWLVRRLSQGRGKTEPQQTPEERAKE